MTKARTNLTIFVLLAIILVTYELLLVTQNGSITMVQQTFKQNTMKFFDQSESINIGKRTLRQLLEDHDITQLPVHIVTDCNDHQVSSNIYSVGNSPIIINAHDKNPNRVCLNESQLYKDSLLKYGISFDQLSVLQQKASIVRAVLNDLERKNQLEIKAELNKYISETEDKDSDYYSQEKQADRESKLLMPEISDDNKPLEDVQVQIINLPPKVNSKRQSLNQLYFPRPHKHRIVGAGKPTLSPLGKKGKKRPPLLLNEDLLKFKGLSVKQSYNLTERGFSSTWKSNSTAVKNRLKFITEAINNTDPSERSAARTSLNPDLLQRAQFQQDKIMHFCHGHTHPSSTMPLGNAELNTLFQHLLYDDTRKIVFCYVPKNGCSNMKRLMLVLNGILPPEASKGKRPDESVLKEVHSFRNLTYSEAKYRLTHYFKFAIIRNPLERLLSAYKNKLERPFNTNLRKFFPERLKAYILKKYRRSEFQEWISKNNSSVDIHPSFDEFIQFMNTFPLSVYNEHFKPFLELCNPCAVKFDLFMNFKTLEYDIFALMEYLGIPFALYPEAIAHRSEPTSSLLEDYYSQISTENKEQLFHRLNHEFQFYFTLHPEEWGMNSHL